MNTIKKKQYIFFSTQASKLREIYIYYQCNDRRDVKKVQKRKKTIYIRDAENLREKGCTGKATCYTPIFRFFPEITHFYDLHEIGFTNIDVYIRNNFYFYFE